MTDPSPGAGQDAARLVFVCYANHCRSPMMELLLRAALDRTSGDAAPVLVSSAGTHARPGVAAHPYALQALAERGLDGSRWRSSRLSVETVEQADLIITAAADQRREVVAMSAGAAARTFTLLDFAAWLNAGPATPGRGVPELLTRAAAGRGRLAGRHRERDLPDPMGRSLRQFRLCRRRIEAALEPFLGAG